MFSKVPTIRKDGREATADQRRTASHAPTRSWLARTIPTVAISTPTNTRRAETSDRLRLRAACRDRNELRTYSTAALDLPALDLRGLPRLAGLLPLASEVAAFAAARSRRIWPRPRAFASAERALA